MNTRRDLLIGLGATVVGTAALRHFASPRPEQPATNSSDWRRDAMNVVVTDHSGRNFRFYDDLVSGQVVAVNLMYTACEGICPMATGNLRQVQRSLGERCGRDIRLYSITLDPASDDPARLRDYVEQHRIGAGWRFLTGDPESIKRLRFALGFYDRDPLIDRDKNTHTGFIRIGNASLDRWTMAPALAAPDQILATINHVDPQAVLTDAGESPLAGAAG